MTYEDRVRPEWIDHNEHMNLAYYVLVFEAALAALRRALALPGALRVEQMHTVYAREVGLGDPLAVETLVLAADATRLHLFQQMRHAGEGYLAATLELVAAHDAPFAPEAASRIAALVAPPPEGAGRRIGMARR